MRLGKEAMEALQAEICGRLMPGNELVVAGAIGLEGTALIARQEYARLRMHFSESFLRECQGLWSESAKREKAKREKAVQSLGECEKQAQQMTASETSDSVSLWELAKEAGATALYAMNEGGFLCALWKMAEASQVGLEMDFTKVPIRQETIEICEIFDINPYRLRSGGALLIGVPAGEGLVHKLHRMGVMAAVIGQANAGNDRLLYYNGNARYLDRPTEDEIYKVIEKR